MKKALVLVLIVAAVLLAACGNKSEKQDNGTEKNTVNPTTETTPTDVPSPTEAPFDQAQLEKADEELAEQVRTVIEVGSADIEPYDELNTALAGTMDDVKIFVLSDTGLEAFYTCPSMQSFIDDNFGDKLKSGNLFQSEKYNDRKYLITAHNLTADGAALQLVGRWE